MNVFPGSAILVLDDVSIRQGQYLLDIYYVIDNTWNFNETI